MKDITVQEEQMQKDRLVILQIKEIFVLKEIIAQLEFQHQLNVQQENINQIKERLVLQNVLIAHQDPTAKLQELVLPQDYALKDFTVREEILLQLQQQVFVLLVITVQLEVSNRFNVMKEIISLLLNKILVHLVQPTNIALILTVL